MDKFLLLPGTVPGSRTHPPNHRTRALRSRRLTARRGYSPDETIQEVLKDFESQAASSNSTVTPLESRNQKQGVCHGEDSRTTEPAGVAGRLD